LSPRAAWRLATFGFTSVHDYAVGKVDWLAHGLPAEGTDAGLPTAGTLARHDVATCSIDDETADVLDRIAASPYRYAIVLGPGDVVLGRVRKSRLERGGGVEPNIDPGPRTVRPHLTPAQLAGRFERVGVRTLIVTTPEGVMLGVVGREDVPAPR
jgi:hypothetical protein